MGDPQWLINYRALVEHINSNPTADWSTQQSASHQGTWLIRYNLFVCVGFWLWESCNNIFFYFHFVADSTDVLSTYQESLEYNEQYQQHQYDPNQYYDPYQQQQQQQQHEIDGGQQHQYEQLPQENNQQVSYNI